MKDYFLLTAVCVVVVLAVGWLLLPGSAGDFFRTRVTIEAETPDAPDPDPAPAAVPVEPQPRPARVRVPERVEQASVSPPPIEVKPVPKPAETMRVPMPWEVLPGEQRSEVVNTYGTPTLSTSTQDAGHLFETFVYGGSRSQSIVHLQDGKVSTVLLKDYPILARP